MLGRLFAWMRRQREWTRAHTIAWKGAAGPGRDGYSSFQVECEAAISMKLATVGRVLLDRVVHKAHSVQFVSATISGTQLEIWIYADQVNLGGREVDRRFEEWAAVSPAELIQEFCRTMMEHLPGSAESAV